MRILWIWYPSFKQTHPKHVASVESVRLDTSSATLCAMATIGAEIRKRTLRWGLCGQGQKFLSFLLVNWVHLESKTYSSRKKYAYFNSSASSRADSDPYPMPARPHPTVRWVGPSCKTVRTLAVTHEFPVPQHTIQGLSLDYGRLRHLQYSIHFDQNRAWIHLSEAAQIWMSQVNLGVPWVMLKTKTRTIIQTSRRALPIISG
jgi:hypothetical protein